jgi:hypothetical protein
MKITLNLAPAESVRDRIALAWAVPVSVVCLIFLVFLGRVTTAEIRHYHTVEVQLDDVQRKTADLHQQEMEIRSRLDDPVSRQLLQRANFVNGLIDQKKLSLTDVTARIAGLLPEDAHLTGFELSSPKKEGAIEYDLRMAITARNEDAVEQFVNDLEDAPDFQDVSIVNQGFQADSTLPDQVNIMCQARYLPGTDLSKENTSEEKPTPNHQ